MNDIFAQILFETQFRFRLSMRSTRIIFLQEKCIEHQIPFYQIFVDLTNAVDITNR